MTEEFAINPRQWIKGLKSKLAVPALSVYLAGLRRTVNVDVHGQPSAIRELIERDQPFIPCYWHQQNLLCAIYLMDLKAKHGFRAGFLVSPSRDGEIPTRLFRRWGAHVIRGSSSHTGAQALRDLHVAITRDKVSPANTPDGPRGPRFECKLGPLMLSQMTQAPIVPMAAAASSFWQLSSWDRFVLPKWRSRIAVVIGTPIHVEKKQRMNELEPLRLRLQAELIRLSDTARDLAKI